MDPNFEGPKIPLMTLAGITSLTDVLHELPLPGPHPDVLDCPLFAYATVPMPGIRRLANSSNPSNILNIVEALSRVSTEEIVLKNPSQDTDCLEGLNVPPLLQAVLANRPDIFYRKKSSTEKGGNITGKHHSPVQAATPQSPAIGHKGLPMYQRSPAECAASESSLRNTHVGHHVQTPPSNQSSHLVQHQHVNSVGVQNSQFAVNVPQPQPVPDETPKLRLKIKRKAKPGKDPNQDSRSAEDNQSGVQYDIISGPVEQSANSSTRSLKLKLTRIKHEPGVHQTPSSVEETEPTQRSEHIHTASNAAVARNVSDQRHSVVTAVGNIPDTKFESANGFYQNHPVVTPVSHVSPQLQQDVSNFQQSQASKEYTHGRHSSSHLQPQSSTGLHDSDAGLPLSTPRRKGTGKGSSASRSKKKIIVEAHEKTLYVVCQRKRVVEKYLFGFKKMLGISRIPF